MPTYAYVAMNTSGKEAKGEIEAASQEEAISKIRNKKLFPIKIKLSSPRVPTGKADPGTGSFFARVGQKIAGMGRSAPEGSGKGIGDGPAGVTTPGNVKQIRPYPVAPLKDVGPSATRRGEPRPTGSLDQPNGRKHFIGIGNNSYDLDKSGFRPLRFAESDAESLAKVLREQFAFNTETFIGPRATKSNVEAALTCGKVNGIEVRPEDLFVLMFACHGSVTNFDGHYYLHLFGATTEHSACSLRATELTSILHGRAFKSQHVLTIYDACRSLTLQLPNSRGTVSAGQDLLSRDIGSVQNNPSRTVATLFGCAQNEVSFEDPDTLKSGVLSYFLRESASEPGVTTVWDWVSRATRGTHEWSRGRGTGSVQRPWQSGVDYLQDFVLRRVDDKAPE